MPKNTTKKTRTVHAKVATRKAAPKLKMSIGDKAKALLKEVCNIDISEFARRHNNNVIKNADGDFAYGTNDGEFYGEFETHEDYVRGMKNLFNARTEKVHASVDKLVTAKRLTRKQANTVIAGMVERGQIAG